MNSTITVNKLTAFQCLARSLRYVGLSKGDNNN